LPDIQKEMLEKARCKIEKARLHNVGFTQGDAVDLPFGENEFDVVFLVAVLGEVSDPEACLQSIYKVLCPLGLLSITEQPGDPDFLLSDLWLKSRDLNSSKVMAEKGITLRTSESLSR